MTVLDTSDWNYFVKTKSGEHKTIIDAVSGNFNCPFGIRNNMGGSCLSSSLPPSYHAECKQLISSLNRVSSSYDWVVVPSEDHALEYALEVATLAKEQRSNRVFIIDDHTSGGRTLATRSFDEPTDLRSIFQLTRLPRTEVSKAEISKDFLLLHDCFIVDPISILTGEIISKSELEKLRDFSNFCEGYLVVNERFTSFGRCGVQGFLSGSLSDIVILGTPIANGLPIGIVGFSKDKFDQLPPYPYSASIASIKAASHVVQQVLNDKAVTQKSASIGTLFLSLFSDAGLSHRISASGSLIHISFGSEKSALSAHKTLLEDHSIICFQYKRYLIFAPVLVMPTDLVERIAKAAVQTCKKAV